MKKLFLALAIFLITTPSFAVELVDGYFRQDGTYVAPHYRSSPNNIVIDNYSYQGNSAYPLGNRRGGVDLSVFGRQKTLIDYQNEMQQNNMLQQQLYLMQQQNLVNSSADPKLQIYSDGLNQIGIDCDQKRLQGEYKSLEGTAKKCVNPQALKLASQMRMPNMENIRAYLTNFERVARQFDKGQISEEEGIRQIQSYPLN